MPALVSLPVSRPRTEYAVSLRAIAAAALRLGAIRPPGPEAGTVRTAGGQDADLARRRHAGSWRGVHGRRLPQGGTASVEHCYCTEDISRSDDVRAYGPFELADPKSLDQIEDCLRQIARPPTF